MNNLCLEFINSEWYDGWGHLRDRLASRKWLRAFLTRQFAGARLSSPNPEVKNSLYRLRALLRKIIEIVSQGGDPPDDLLRRLNSFLIRSSWHYFLWRQGPNYEFGKVPHRASWNWVLTSIAASACDLLLNYDRRRIKVCPNSGCRWVFYDETRGRVRRWCAPDRCGNLDKVRRFRTRRKQAGLKPNHEATRR